MRQALLARAGLVIAISGIGWAGGAQAQDWAGFYLGAHGGYGFGSLEGCGIPPPGTSCSDPTATPIASDPSGWLAGGQLGYNALVGNGLLLGFELSASLADISDAVNVTPPSPLGTVTVGWLSTATVRLGYGGDKFLLYGEAGAALGGLNYDICGGSGNNVSGWTAGGGVEVGISDRASAFAEYAFVSFGEDSRLCIVGPAFATNLVADVDLHVIKVGFNYSLGGLN